MKTTLDASETVHKSDDTWFVNSLLENTPWWVFIIFFFLLYWGIRSLKPSKMHINHVIAFPILLLCWSLIGFFREWNVSWLLPIFWLIFLLLGAYLGWRFTKNWKIGVNREYGFLFLPGTKSTLILVSVLFVFKYGFGVLYKFFPIPSLSILLIDAIGTGFLTGIFSGRSFFLWCMYSNSST